MTDHDARYGRGYGLSVQLDLNLDRHPITGRLRTQEGIERFFIGWLGFLDALKQVHAAAGSRDAADDGGSIAPQDSEDR